MENKKRHGKEHATRHSATAPKTRIVYCMAKEESMSYKQISEILDISERTVNTHITTAIRKLTESLKKYFK